MIKVKLFDTFFYIECVSGFCSFVIDFYMKMNNMSVYSLEEEDEKLLLLVRAGEESSFYLIQIRIFYIVCTVVVVVVAGRVKVEIKKQVQKVLQRRSTSSNE